MPSPFEKKSAAAAAAPAAAATAEKPAPAGLPEPVAKGSTSPDKVGAKADPFGNIADASGISGYKSSFFLGQMVLMNPTETGEMQTTVVRDDGKPSPYVRFNIVPLTVPEPGQVNAHIATLDDDGMIQILNKDGDIERCEAYEVGERLEDVLIYNAPLIREGRKALDSQITWIRGRIVKGNKKPGQSAPYILKALDEDDVEIYNAGLEIARAKMRG